MPSPENQKTPKKNRPQKTPINPWNPGRIFGFIFLACLVAAVIFGAKNIGNNEKIVTQKDIGLNEVVSLYQSGAYEKVEVRDNILTATRKSRGVTNTIQGKTIVITEDQVTLPGGPNSLRDLGFDVSGKNTKFVIADTSFEKAFWEMVPTILGIIVMIGIAVLMMGKMMGGGGALSFGKNKARMYDPTTNAFTFNDVAGSEEEKAELREFVDFLKDPKKYNNLGAKIPRGVLMVGNPGTGKTLLARAIAGESHVPFFYVSGSEFVEMFVGVGSARVRDLFKEAREKSPSIIFIDEIDAIGKKRSPGIGGGHDEREQTLNQILTEMDGFDNETNVIVIAATNRIDVLDKALLRPGRFDRKVNIALPNIEDRIKILQLHAKGKPVEEGINWRAIASLTAGMSGADLANILNEAAILAGRENAKIITQHMINRSIERISVGNTRKSLKLTDKEKKIVSYHEIGHAILSRVLPYNDPVHKVSIIARGGALGVTWTPAEKDQVLTPRAKFLDEICMIFGGRIAEETFFGAQDVTTGASGDIEQATRLARQMVTRFGFDDEVGPENLTNDEAVIEGIPSSVSEKTRELIDLRVREILKAQMQRAREILGQYRDLHVQMAEELLVKEEFHREEFEAYFAGRTLPEKAIQ